MAGLHHDHHLWEGDTTNVKYCIHEEKPVDEQKGISDIQLKDVYAMLGIKCQ